MKFLQFLLFLSLPFYSACLSADQLSADAAIGGGLGGALGGFIGAEAGDRNTAILGSAAGAALGSAISTQNHLDTGFRQEHLERYIDYQPQYKKHKPHKKCPPGLAMQGRC